VGSAQRAICLWSTAALMQGEAVAMAAGGAAVVIPAASIELQRGAFSDRPIVLQSQGSAPPPPELIGELLPSGHGRPPASGWRPPPPANGPPPPTASPSS